MGEGLDGKEGHDPLRGSKSAVRAPAVQTTTTDDPQDSPVQGV